MKLLNSSNEWLCFWDQYNFRCSKVIFWDQALEWPSFWSLISLPGLGKWCWLFPCRHLPLIDVIGSSASTGTCSVLCAMVQHQPTGRLESAIVPEDCSIRAHPETRKYKWVSCHFFDFVLQKVDNPTRQFPLKISQWSDVIFSLPFTSQFGC